MVRPPGSGCGDRGRPHPGGERAATRPAQQDAAGGAGQDDAGELEGRERRVERLERAIGRPGHPGDVGAQRVAGSRVGRRQRGLETGDPPAGDGDFDHPAARRQPGELGRVAPQCDVGGVLDPLAVGAEGRLQPLDAAGKGLGFAAEAQQQPPRRLEVDGVEVQGPPPELGDRRQRGLQRADVDEERGRRRRAREDLE